LRPTPRARHRLGMKTSIAGILVFLSAVVTKLERLHRRSRSIVRHALDDRPARPTVRAVGERITIPSLGRVANLGQTLIAHCQISGDRRPRRRLSAAFNNAKTRRSHQGRSLAIDGRHVERIDAGLRRMPIRERLHELFDRARLALNFDSDGVGLILHPACQMQGPRQVIDKRTKPDALHNARRLDGDAFFARAGRLLN